MPGRLAALFKGATDLLFPPRCVVCGRGDDFLCDGCVGEMKRADPPASPDGWRGLAGGRAGPPWPVFWYEGTARSAVLALKFRGLWACGEAMGELMADLAEEEGFACDVVVPVPLHPRRLRQRGFNQAELLARSVALRLGVPLRTDILRRSRATPHQSLIGESARRRANVEGAFAATGDPGTLRVLLIDDVSTTGATIEVCQQALLDAGAVAVAALVFAHER